MLGVMAQLLSVPWREGLDVESGGPQLSGGLRSIGLRGHPLEWMGCLEIVWSSAKNSRWERSFKFVLI